MDLSLRCNNHIDGYCRKELRHEAFVTTCSHIFCKECVQKYGFQDVNPRRECLACGTRLASIGDVVFASLRPSEDQQSTILSGFVPNTILECAGKAIRFWNYQMSTEIAWQEHLAKEMTTKYQNLHTNARKVVDEANTEIGELQQRIESLTLEKREAERRTEEMVGMYKEKSKRCQTFSELYEALKNKVQAEQSRNAAAASAHHTLQSIDPVPITTAYGYHQLHRARTGTTTELPNIKRTPNKSKYLIDHGVEQLHPFQRSGSATRAQTSSEIGAATIGMGPPTHPIGRQMTGRLSTTTTPAQRMTLTRPTANNTFPQSAHRVSMSQQFAPRSLDRSRFEDQNLSRENHITNGQHVSGRAVLTPNIHSRMPANRELF